MRSNDNNVKSPLDLLGRSFITKVSYITIYIGRYAVQSWRHTSADESVSGMSELKWIFIFAVQTFFIGNTVGSTGDKSQFYNLCLDKCCAENCENGK